MRLYHFVDAHYGLDDIGKRRLKIARINELNDPFEFSSVNLRDRELRRAFKAMKTEMARKRGLVCFSTKWSNPVMWSHYADKHRGLCLGFDAKAQAVGKVAYSRKRLVVEMENLESPRELEEDYVRELLFTKYSHWRYENEYRAFVTLEDEDQTTGHYFVEFGDGLVLKEVIVGAESTISRGELSEALGGLSSSVRQIKARLAFGTFSVVRQRKEALWS